MTQKFTWIVLSSVLLLTACDRDKRPFVISKIQSVSKLATTETIIDKTVVGTKSKRVLGLVRLSDAYFVAYTEATVKTGIDLSKLKANDVRIKGKEITLKLPAVEVLDFQYPFQKFEVDTSIVDDALFNRFDVIDYEKFYRQAELDIREQLQYTGIVKATQNKTRTMMNGLLKNLGYEAIFIEFDETKELFKIPNLTGKPEDEPEETDEDS